MESTKSLGSLRKCLIDCDRSGIADIIRRNHDVDLSDILPIIVSQLNECVKENNATLFECAEIALRTIVEVYDAEDVLLLIVDDIRCAADDTAFLKLTFILLDLLFRLSKKWQCPLSWGLDAVSAYYSNIAVPDLDDGRITNLYSALLPFYKTLIDAISGGNDEDRTIVLKFTLQLLGKPLALVDFASARPVMEEVIELLFEIKPDLFSLLDMNPLYDMEIDKLALGTLFYLILAEGFTLSRLPQVYSAVYIFQQCLPLITVLLRHESVTIRNALNLLEAVTDRLVRYVLPSHLLDCEHHSEFCKTLTNIILYNEDHTVRQTALRLYRRYLFLFDNRGRYLLVYNLTDVLDDPNIIGYTITQFKDMLAQALDEKELSAYFSGTNLYHLLERFCVPDTYDKKLLLDTSEQTLAVLNLLRFLVIRDGENLTGIRDYFRLLDDRFLNPLKEGLVAARDFHRKTIRDLSTVDETVAVTVGDEGLPEFSHEEKLKCLEFGLVTYDMIDDLLSRLCELIHL